MTVSTFTLLPDQLEALRARHPAAPDQSWVPEVVQRQGWAVANARYLEGERARSAEAMRDLLAELRVDGPRDPDDALDLITLAFEVFAPEGGFTGSLRRGPGSELYVQNAQCPTNELMESQGGLGITACASWHRRRGWLDALNVEATDSVLSEKRWGSPACSTLLRIRSVGVHAA